MQVIVTETFRIDIDQYGNHQPEYFKAGGDVIEKGKYAGNITEDRWIKASKYFRNPAQTIWWGIENGHIPDQHEPIVDESMSVRFYLERLEDRIKLLESLLKGQE